MGNPFRLSFFCAAGAAGIALISLLVILLVGASLSSGAAKALVFAFTVLGGVGGYSFSPRRERGKKKEN